MKPEFLLIFQSFHQGLVKAKFSDIKALYGATMFCGDYGP